MSPGCQRCILAVLALVRLSRAWPVDEYHACGEDAAQVEGLCPAAPEPGWSSFLQVKSWADHKRGKRAPATADAQFVEGAAAAVVGPEDSRGGAGESVNSSDVWDLAGLKEPRPGDVQPVVFVDQSCAQGARAGGGLAAPPCQGLCYEGPRYLVAACVVGAEVKSHVTVEGATCAGLGFKMGARAPRNAIVKVYTAQGHEPPRLSMATDANKTSPLCAAAMPQVAQAPVAAPEATASPAETIPGCEPIDGTAADVRAKVRECGHYSFCQLPTLERELCYPGRGVGDPVTGQSYVVRFDDADGNCHEGVVRNQDHWGNLGEDWPGLGAGSFDRMGSCGGGSVSISDAFDCLKHDLCAVWKTVQQERLATGFCDDPDCGDEAAQTVFNCRTSLWEGFAPSICACDGSTGGSWSRITWLWPGAGNCAQWQGCASGNGIPSRDEMGSW